MKPSWARPGQHYLIFDGDCGVCTRAAQLCEDMNRRDLFYVVPSQALSSQELAQLGLDRRECEGELKVVERDGHVRGGAFAVNYFLFKTPPWTALVVLIYLIPIFLLIEISLYRIVARNRTAISRWLGLSACRASRM